MIIKHLIKRSGLFLFGLAMTSTLGFGLTAMPALAQTEAQAGGDADKNKPLLLSVPESLPESLKPRWTKICTSPAENTPETCVTSADLRNERGQSLTSVGVKYIGDADPVMIVALPIGVLLPAGYLLKVDENKIEVNGIFFVCSASACIGETKISKEFVQQIKRGNDLFVVFRLGSQQAVAAKIPLAGSTKALEGPPINPEKLQEQNKVLDTKLKELASKYQEKLAKEQAAGSQ